MIESEINRENNIQDEDDDIPKLSAETLKALQEFYAESELIENKTDVNENWVFKFYFHKKLELILCIKYFRS